VKRSTERILTTHTGSLPRPPDLARIAEDRDQRSLRDDPAFEGQVKDAVADVVSKQARAGIDVLNDGEVSKRGFTHYITERVTGFDGQPRPQPPFREMAMFPEFYGATMPFVQGGPPCTGPITWCGDESVKRDIANLTAALRTVPSEEAFMSAVSPGQVWFNFPNDYYPSDEAYVLALSDAMRNEYRAIVGAGFVLQLDGPELAMSWGRPEFADKTFKDYRKFVALHIEAINHALEGIPPDRVRMHVCWGNSERPHVHDIPLAEIIDTVYRAKVGALVVEGANPRHGHEWKTFKEHPLPEGMIIIPGVVDTLTNFVEHPELIAQRIDRLANIVGGENVIAGTDCGFSTNVRAQPRVHPTVAWAKLQSLAEGAKLASKALQK
jgi:5-methyltetrahydropteroyltriglutamate--homocysteine methyltransferase